jgi:putative tryptophan/tyrosine transport system substrate-binding protein
MRRRELLLLGTAAALSPGIAAAQPKAMPVIGFLHSLSAGQSNEVVAAFNEGLAEAGYFAGRNVAIEYRWAEGKYDRLAGLAAGLAALKPSVIVAGGGTPPAAAAKHATSTIPIVFASVGDPVEMGLVASFARPGGNVTGVSVMTVELMPKRLELLSELVPGAGSVALLVNPNIQTSEQTVGVVQEAASAKRVQLHVLNAGTESELYAAFASLPDLRPGALLVGADPFFYNHRQELVALVSRHALPAIYELRGFVDSGGLMSYGTSLVGNYRQAGAYVGRILKGERPADLPIQRPTKFELVVNLKTANALRLTVPQTLLARADEVIE